MGGVSDERHKRESTSNKPQQCSFHFLQPARTPISALIEIETHVSCLKFIFPTDFLTPIYVCITNSKSAGQQQMETNHTALSFPAGSAHRTHPRSECEVMHSGSGANVRSAARCARMSLRRHFVEVQRARALLVLSKWSLVRRSSRSDGHRTPRYLPRTSGASSMAGTHTHTRRHAHNAAMSHRNPFSNNLPLTVHRSGTIRSLVSRQTPGFLLVVYRYLDG